MSMTKYQADLLTYWLIMYGDRMISYSRLYDAKIAVCPAYDSPRQSAYRDLYNSTLDAEGLVKRYDEKASITDKAKRLLQEMGDDKKPS